MDFRITFQILPTKKTHHDFNSVIAVFKLRLILRNVILLQGWLYQSRKLDVCLHLPRSSFVSLHKVLQFSYMGQSSIFFKGTINFAFLGLQNLWTGRDLKTILSSYLICCWAHLSNNQRYRMYFCDFFFLVTWWHYITCILCDFHLFKW